MHLLKLFVPVCFAQDIDHLQQVWEITQNWNANWDVWKGGQFATLQTEGMERAVQDMFKKIVELHRDLKVSSATQNQILQILASCHKLYYFTSVSFVIFI